MYWMVQWEGYIQDSWWARVGSTRCSKVSITSPMCSRRFRESLRVSRKLPFQVWWVQGARSTSDNFWDFNLKPNEFNKIQKVSMRTFEVSISLKSSRKFKDASEASWGFNHKVNGLIKVAKQLLEIQLQNCFVERGSWSCQENFWGSNYKFNEFDKVVNQLLGFQSQVKLVQKLPKELLKLKKQV